MMRLAHVWQKIKDTPGNPGNSCQCAFMARLYREGIAMIFTLKNMILLPLAILFVGCASTREPSTIIVHPEPESSVYSPRDSLKNWALSICFARIALDDKDARDDADRSASVYSARGNARREERDKIFLLVKQYVSRKYGGFTDIGIKPAEFHTMKCIDLFHSAELDDLVARLLEERDR
jgi:hypothetical protein